MVIENRNYVELAKKFIDEHNNNNNWSPLDRIEMTAIVMFAEWLTKINIRIGEPPEQIEFHAHHGECKYCGGIVKMYRDQVTMKLHPDNCCCIVCGQPYFVVIEDTIECFELQQWRQKGQTFAMGGD